MRIVAELVAIVVATATTNAPLYNQSTQVNRNIVDSINFNFYQDNNHTLQLTQAYLGDQIYARIETDPTVENLNLQINSCYATSTSDSGTKFKVVYSMRSICEQVTIQSELQLTRTTSFYLTRQTPCQ